MSCFASGRGGSYKVTSPTSARGPASGPLRHRQRPISFEGELADTGLRRLNRWGLKSARLGDGPHGPLHHAETLPILIDHGFCPPIFRIKRCERDRRNRRHAIEDVMHFCRSEECQVNRILVGFLRRECARKQHLGFRRVLQRNHAGDRQLVHRNRARLIHAKHVHRRGILRGAKPRDQHTTLCQLLRAEGHADGEHNRESHRHRAHQ